MPQSAMSPPVMPPSALLWFDQVDAALAPGLQLHSLPLRVAAGDCIAVHGPALARAAFADLALGLRRPDAGRVLVDGDDWARLSPAAAAARRAGIGCVLDRPGFLSNLDVGENLALAERLHRGRRTDEVLAEAAAIADRLGFGALPECRPYALDRQARHRLVLVRALLGERRLLLVEELPGACDASAMAALAAELQARRQRGAAVVWLGDAPPGDGFAAGSALDLRLGRAEDAA